MGSGLRLAVLVSSFAVHFCHFDVTDWDEVVVAREDTPTTLICTDPAVSGNVAINWKVKPFDADDCKLLLSASVTNQVSGDALKPSMQLTDPSFHKTGVFSLFLLPKLDDKGVYSCLIRQQERTIKEHKILLAILQAEVYPSPTIPQHSTLRLIASVHPNYPVSEISWTAPSGVYMKSERGPNISTVAKLPEVGNSDEGVYVCTVYLRGTASSFAFNVNVSVDAHKVASFTNITHAPEISTATTTHVTLPLTCPSVRGDYVMVHWRPPDTLKRNNMKLVHQYDRWRDSTFSALPKKLQLDGPPYNAKTGSFSFLLSPAFSDGGLYICTVFLNDVAFSQRTAISVLKVRTRKLSTKWELVCQYSEHIQVQSASWKHENESRRLHMSSSSPGTVVTIVSLPITQDTAGNYTCKLKLKNGQTIWASQAVPLPSEELVSATTSSLLPSLSALLLLVPLVAVSVGVLLWRQKHISDRGVEQSLSVHSGEVENIYENPEDIRQAPPQGPVYMDLKPRGENDVYKELERYEQCQN